VNEIEQRVVDAVEYVQATSAPGSDPHLCAEIAERALLTHEHAEGSKPFGHGMRAAAKAILGLIEFPPEWRSAHPSAQRPRRSRGEVDDLVERALGYAARARAAHGPGFVESDGDAMFVALADIVARAREWHADVDLVYPSETEQRIRNALHEVLYGFDGEGS
jgi:hypothetical protein